MGLRLVSFLCAFSSTGTALGAASVVAGSSDPSAISKEVAAAKAATFAARDLAAKVRERLRILAAARKETEGSIKAEQTALGKHWRDAQAAYTLSPPTPSIATAMNKPKKQTPLPRVEALQIAKVEYLEIGRLGTALLRDRAALRRTEDEINQQNQVATATAAKAGSSNKELQRLAKLLAAQAQASAQAAKKDKSDSATKAALDLKEKADHAQADAKEAQAATSAADQDASKSHTIAGLGSESAYGTRRAAADKDEAKLKTNLEGAQQALKEVDAALDLQSPLIRGCDLRNLDWKNMTYPWYPFGTAGKPLKLVNGAYVCDESDPQNCPQMGVGIDGALYGDLAGDGSQHAVVEIAVPVPELSIYDVLFFGKDAECHLRFLGVVPQNTTSGSIRGNAYVADLPYAKPGENMGVGNETGVEHAEWRIVKGKLKKTLSLKK